MNMEQVSERFKENGQSTATTDAATTEGEKNVTIGEFARRTGVARSALRYYEREGLLESPARLDNGYRVYHESAVQKVVFIKTCQDLGFKLGEIKSMLRDHELSSLSCEDVETLLLGKESVLLEKIEELQTLLFRVRGEIRKAGLRNEEKPCCTVRRTLMEKQNTPDQS